MGKRGRRRARGAGALASLSEQRGAAASACVGSPARCSEGAASPGALLSELQLLVHHRRQVDIAIRELVDQLAAANVGWGDIGRALGMTRQGARQGFSRPR